MYPKPQYSSMRQPCALCSDCPLSENMTAMHDINNYCIIFRPSFEELGLG